MSCSYQNTKIDKREVRDDPSWVQFAPVIFLVMWSTSYVAAKFGLAYAEPMTFLALRFAIVISIMLPLYFWFRPPLPKSPSEWMHLTIVGFLLQSMYFGMCYMSFNAGLTVGVLALVLSFQPIIVGIVAPRWNGEIVGFRQWLGLIIGLIGASVVILTSFEISPPSNLGFLYAVLALFGITVSSLWEKRFGVSQNPVTTNLVSFTVGLIGILPFMLVFETMEVNWTWQLFSSLAYLVIASSLIATGLLLMMIRLGDVSKVSSLFFLVPPMAAGVAWVVLDEAMPLLAWVGLFIAGFGVYVANKKKQ